MDINQIDLNLLRVFVAVVEQESLSAAARKLDVPVSSVSRTITRLEEELGAQLLVRTTRRMTKTAAGEALYQGVAPILASLSGEIARLTERVDAPAGMLRITAPVELGSPYLAEAVSRFMTRYPRVHVHAHLSNEVVNLVKEGFDLALRFSGAQLKDSSLVATKASPLAGGIYAAPSYVARKGTPRTAGDLEKHEWVVFSRLPRTLHFGAGKQRTAVKINGRASASEILYVRDLIRAGAGVGFLPAFLAQADVAAGTLVHVVPKATMWTGSLWIVRPAGKHVPAIVTAFKDFMLAYLKSHPLAPSDAAG